MKVKFHKNCENAGEILKISCVRCNFFSGPHKKFSLVLLQITNYILSPRKMQKRMQDALNYFGIRLICRFSQR